MTSVWRCCQQGFKQNTCAPPALLVTDPVQGASCLQQSALETGWASQQLRADLLHLSFLRYEPDLIFPALEPGLPGMAFPRALFPWLLPVAPSLSLFSGVRERSGSATTAEAQGPAQAEQNKPTLHRLSPLPLTGVYLSLCFVPNPHHLLTQQTYHRHEASGWKLAVNTNRAGLCPPVTRSLKGETGTDISSVIVHRNPCQGRGMWRVRGHTDIRVSGA